MSLRRPASILPLAFALCAAVWLVSDRVQARGSGPDTGNRVIPYRGQLSLNGAPVPSGTVPMTFTLRGVMASGPEQTWTYGPVDVDLFAGEFSVRIGETAAVPQWVYDARETYVGVAVNGSPLNGEQRIYPVPYATWASEARDLHVEGRLTVNGDISNQAADGQMAPSANFAFRDTGDSWLRLRTGMGSESYADLAVKSQYNEQSLTTRGIKFNYAAWNSYGVGEGEAAIYNDSGDYKKLMIVGNNSAGGVRQVGLWDDVTVNRNLHVTGSLCVGGTCGQPFLGCNWSGDRAIYGDQGCADDITITCTNGRVTGFRIHC